MDNFSINGAEALLAEFETPFADAGLAGENLPDQELANFETSIYPELESPFAQTFEPATATQQTSPYAQDYVQLLGELHDSGFTNMLDELAGELEDNWLGKISNEVAMGDSFIPYTGKQAQEYFAPMLAETDAMIDRTMQNFSGNNLADYSNEEMERFFAEFELSNTRFSPVQEQFFGSILKKVKSVVKKGVDLAKKGISAVGKLLPVNIILNKLKGLIRPLLDKVLKFAINKLPKNLQPYANTLANKFLNHETTGEANYDQTEMPAGGDLDAVQSELDNVIANLVFSGEDTQAEELVMNYETSDQAYTQELNYETGGLQLPSLEEGRQQLINDLKDLKEGETAAPAIERFLPVAIMALQPVIKMAMGIIGRQKIINFLAGLLAKLVGRYVPENVARPLAASIIDVGMSAIGFETYEAGKPDLAYEAIANTIQDTIQNLGALSEATLDDPDALTGELLEAFETAAANNFPAQYIKQSARKSSQHGLWVLKPRSGPRHYYKKFTRVFTTELTPQMAGALKTFKGAPLSNFLRDKLGLDPAKTQQVRVHLYEAINGTRLSLVNKFEKVPGLGAAQPHGQVQFHPLTVEAASLLCKEPGLGKDTGPASTGKKHRTTIGQRFYFLEISGARLRIAAPANTNAAIGTASAGQVASTSDVQAVADFIRSRVAIRYYFSEEEAMLVVQKLNSNDYLGAGMSIRQSVKKVLNDMLLSNVSNKVKIIHEQVPELFLENSPGEEQFSAIGTINKAIGGISLSTGKVLLQSLVKQLVDKLASKANEALANHFKTRAAEFKQAQAAPADGVTVTIAWNNIPGMNAIKSMIAAIRGNGNLTGLGDLSLPQIPAPEVTLLAGKKFD